MSAARSGEIAVVVDTMVFNAVLSSRRAPRLAQLYEQHLTGRRVVLSFQTVAEIRFGALNDNWGQRRLDNLEARLAVVQIAGVDDRLIRAWAELRLACTRAGHSLAQKEKAADRWIAATAIRYELPLVSHDPSSAAPASTCATSQGTCEYRRPTSGSRTHAGQRRG